MLFSEESRRRPADFLAACKKSILDLQQKIGMCDRSTVNGAQQALPNSCHYKSPPQERTKGTNDSSLSRIGLLLLPATGLSSQNPADTGPTGTPNSCAACCKACFTGEVCMAVLLLARALFLLSYIATSPTGLRLFRGFLQVGGKG